MSRVPESTPRSQRGRPRSRLTTTYASPSRFRPTCSCITARSSSSLESAPTRSGLAGCRAEAAGSVKGQGSERDPGYRGWVARARRVRAAGFRSRLLQCSGTTVLPGRIRAQPQTTGLRYASPSRRRHSAARGVLGSHARTQAGHVPAGGGPTVRSCPAEPGLVRWAVLGRAAAAGRGPE